MTTTDTETTTTNIDEVIASYFAMWNADDRRERLAHIEQAWTADARYVDPLSDVTGYEAIADMVEGVRANYPGARLERTTDIDRHHDIARFGWKATGADGALIIEGIDVVEVAGDGRMKGLAGFFG